MSRDIQICPNECPVCNASFTPSRKDQQVCSATCRQRRFRRDRAYIVTEEDRAAIRKVLQDPEHPRPDVPTPDEVRAHILQTAERT